MPAQNRMHSHSKELAGCGDASLLLRGSWFRSTARTVDRTPDRLWINLRVPLTSVDQQSRRIGERAAKLALSVLEHSISRPKQIILQPSLIERASTQRSKTRLP